MTSRRAAVLLGLIGLALVSHLLPGSRTVDDAFITFRYSRNIVQGDGMVYNPGERVLGTTTPLYAALMTLAGGIFGGDYPSYALVVNAVAGAASVVMIFLIVEQLSGDQWLGAWAAALWALAPFAVTFAIGGMETSVHNAIMLGAWFAYLRERPRWLGAACALGVLTRPDALLWAVPLLAHQVWVYLTPRPPLHIGEGEQATRESLQSSPLSILEKGFRGEAKRLPWQTWITGLIIFTPWLIFSTAYFGSPIPQTIGSKAVTYFIDSTQALTLFLQHYATPFQGQITLGTISIIIGIVLYPALAFIGLRATTAKSGRALPMLMYPWIYALVYIIANPLIFRWYLSPPLPAYFMAIVLGIGALLALIPNQRARGIILAAVALVTIVFSLNAWTLNPDHGPNRPTPKMAFHDLELNYQNMALTLRRDYDLADDDVLAAGDIGALGFFSGAEIFDTIGLVTEGTVPYYEDREYIDSIRAEGNYAIPPDLILDEGPDFIVVMEAFVREGLLKDDRFLAQYTLIEEIPTDYYGTGMLAFQRNPD